MTLKKIVIELPHPEDELRVLGDALRGLSQPGISREDVWRSRRVIREARASQRVLSAYTKFLKFRISILERKILELEGK